MEQPVISIITVVYNAGQQLEQTIQSVIGQTYKNIEYIIIDGGSTDNTIGVIKKYSDKIHYWISEPDRGIYDAMNKAVKHANGKWIYFLGAGDILHDVLHALIPKFTDMHTVYYGDVYKLDEQRKYDGYFTGFKLAVSNICHQAIFYPAGVFRRYQYNLNYKFLADHELNIRCYNDNDFKFKYIPVVISDYEGSGLSANNLDIPFYQEKLNIIKINFPRYIYYYAYLRNKLAKLLKRNQLNQRH